MTRTVSQKWKEGEGGERLCIECDKERKGNEEFETENISTF